MNTSKQLLDEIGERISKDKNKKIGFSLLYQTTDKADVDEFHIKCDSKGPTVTILYGQFNTLFGGYTSKSWRSTEKQKVKDENAFLFKKDDSLDAKCVFLPIRKGQTDKAIVCDKHFGPTFGVGMFNRYDLQTFKKDSKPESKKKGDFLKLNGCLNVKFSYSVETQNTDDEDYDGVTELKASDINSGQMLVSKLEVYQVTDDEFEKDWLERIEGDAFTKKKRELMQMKPLPGLDIGQYNVLLLGAVGAGKSSLINTISALVTGKIEPIAPSRQSASSVTNTVKKYDLTSADGDTLKIRFYDIRGFESGRENAQELELLIDGRLPENYQFPEKFNPDDVIEERPNPTLNEQIHLVCFVEENSDFDKYAVAHKEQINAINRIICNKGLPMVVIATKFDKLCPKISENVGHLFKSPKAKKAVDAIASFHGVNKNQVLPVVNYTDEEEGLDAKDQLALKALNRIYHLIEGHLTHHPDRKFVPDGWKDREDALPVWKNDVEKRNLLSEKLTPFDGKNLRILLVGPVDSGKSSFIDSVQSALRSKIAADASIRFAKTTPENISSTTEKFKLFHVEYVDKDTGKPRRSGIRLGDTPGFQEQDGIKDDHVKFIISGNVPDCYKIINGIQDTQDDFQRNPLPGDKIHCVCFVFDCEKVQKGFSESIKTSMKRLQQMIVEQGCPHIVLLTKCDKVSNSLKTGRRRIFDDGNVRGCKDSLMTEFYFKQQQIYPIINYDDQNDVDKHTDRLILEGFLSKFSLSTNKDQKLGHTAQILKNLVNIPEVPISVQASGHKAAFFKILELGKSHMERTDGQE